MQRELLRKVGDFGKVLSEEDRTLDEVGTVELLVDLRNKAGQSLLWSCCSKTDRVSTVVTASHRQKHHRCSQGIREGQSDAADGTERFSDNS